MLLSAVHTSQTRTGIESSAASGIVELYLGGPGRVFICDDETAKGYIAVQREVQCYGLRPYCHLLAAEEGVGEALRIGELYLGGVLHRGVATTAVSHDNQPVVVLLQLEGALAEGGHIGCLVDLLDALSV